MEHVDHPASPISMMPKWRVFAASRLHHCFGGGGKGGSLLHFILFKIVAFLLVIRRGSSKCTLHELFFNFVKVGVNAKAVLASFKTAFLPVYLGHVSSNAKSLCLSH